MDTNRRSDSLSPAAFIGIVLLAALGGGVLLLLPLLWFKQTKRIVTACFSPDEAGDRARRALKVFLCFAAACVPFMFVPATSALAGVLFSWSFVVGLVVLIILSQGEEEVAQSDATDYLDEWWKDDNRHR